MAGEQLFPDSEGGWICKRHKIEKGSDKYGSNCYRCRVEQIAELQTALTTSEAENKRLKEFARHIICQYCWDMLEPDSRDIQKWAEKLGLIVPHTVTIEDIDEGTDFDVGDTIFKFSETLKGD